MLGLENFSDGQADTRQPIQHCHLSSWPLRPTVPHCSSQKTLIRRKCMGIKRREQPRQPRRHNRCPQRRPTDCKKHVCVQVQLASVHQQNAEQMRKLRTQDLRHLSHHPRHNRCIIPCALRTNHNDIRRKHSADIGRIRHLYTATVRNQNLREERLHVGPIADDRDVCQRRPLLGVGGLR